MSPMFVSQALNAGVVVAVTPAHGVAPQLPVAHWAVLLVVVPTLWLCIAGGVIVVDRLLDRLENRPNH